MEAVRSQRRSCWGSCDPWARTPQKTNYLPWYFLYSISYPLLPIPLLFPINNTNNIRRTYSIFICHNLLILALQLVLLIHSGNFEVMEVDINGDGTIDFEEFLGMMKSKANEADQESDLREAFKIFDRDKDGYIDMKELKKVTNNLDQHEF